MPYSAMHAERLYLDWASNHSGLISGHTWNGSGSSNNIWIQWILPLTSAESDPGFEYFRTDPDPDRSQNVPLASVMSPSFVRYPKSWLF